jgi:hypothetical protein
MPRLPQPGTDKGVWGGILNDYLSQAHNVDGTLKPGVVTGSTVQDGSLTITKTANLQTALNAKRDISAAFTTTELPAGSILFARYNTTTSSWPARPTNRSDVMVHWVGANDTTPPPNALNGVDIWDWEAV